MKKVMASSLVALAMTTGAGVVTAAPAQAADTPRCVTSHEYYSLHKGMTRARVHRILDTRGRLNWRHPGWMGRSYRICGIGPNWFVHVRYRHSGGHWRLYSKWANAE